MFLDVVGELRDGVLHELVEITADDLFGTAACEDCKTGSTLAGNVTWSSSTLPSMPTSLFFGAFVETFRVKDGSNSCTCWQSFAKSAMLPTLAAFETCFDSKNSCRVNIRPSSTCKSTLKDNSSSSKKGFSTSNGVCISKSFSSL